MSAMDLDSNQDIAQEASTSEPTTPTVKTKEPKKRFEVKKASC